MKITIDVDERKTRTRTRYGNGKTKRGNTSKGSGWLPREEWLKQQREKKGGKQE